MCSGQEEGFRSNLFEQLMVGEVVITRLQELGQIVDSFPEGFLKT